MGNTHAPTIVNTRQDARSDANGRQRRQRQKAPKTAPIAIRLATAPNKGEKKSIARVGCVCVQYLRTCGPASMCTLGPMDAKLYHLASWDGMYTMLVR